MRVPVLLVILWGPLHLILGALVYEAGRQRGKYGDKLYREGFRSGQKSAAMARLVRRGIEASS